MLTPSVGLKVHYFDDGAFGDAGTRLAKGQPLAATIAHVISDKRVNLSVIDLLGNPAARVNILLLAEGDEIPKAGEYCLFPDLYNDALATANNRVSHAEGELVHVKGRLDAHKEMMSELWDEMKLLRQAMETPPPTPQPVWAGDPAVMREAAEPEPPTNLPEVDEI